jgi:hypothetical protein
MKPRQLLHRDAVSTFSRPCLDHQVSGPTAARTASTISMVRFRGMIISSQALREQVPLQSETHRDRRARHIREIFGGLRA